MEIKQELLWGQMEALMEKLKFPREEAEQLRAAFAKLERKPGYLGAFGALVQSYENDYHGDFGRLVSHMAILSKQSGFHRYTGNLLLLLAMGDSLRRRFREAGYGDRLFYDAMEDLRYKLEECRLVHGICGTFVPEWYEGFYRVERFRLGRLQFELVPLKCGGVCQGVTLTPETQAINIHIPRNGEPLRHEEVLRSCELARDFYKEQFKDRPTVFTCESWLLYPWVQEVLPEGSNLRAFASDFTLLEQGDDRDYSEVWRLFDCQYTGDPDALPQDTSLRRAFVQRIRAGLPIGWGRGAFLL